MASAAEAAVAAESQAAAPAEDRPVPVLLASTSKGVLDGDIKCRDYGQDDGFEPSPEVTNAGGLGKASRCLWGVLTSPRKFVEFVHSLYVQFGGYIPTAILQYGVNQGIGLSVGGFAMRYYMMDVLGLDGATMGRYATAARVPWNVKPCVGLLSDSLPLFGFHRTGYLIIAGICGVISYSVLGIVPLTALSMVPFYFLVNLSVSAPDVIIDASTAELSKEAPNRASDLQSLSWGALSVGGIAACATKGPLKDLLGSRGLLLMMVACSCSILLPAVMRWLPEERLPVGNRWKLDTKMLCHHKGVTFLAAYMSISAIMLSSLQVFVESANVRGAITVFFGIILAIGIYFTLSKITPLLAKTALFIFLRECIQPGLGESMFVWLTKAEEGPQFSPTMLGWIDCFGSLSLLVGITTYNKYLTKVSYQKIFFFAQIAMVISNFSDYVLVKRWNISLGIPDFVFIVGDDAFTVVMSRFFQMPLFVLASKVCPDNLEATLFAMLMSLSNFGSTVSEFAGVTLCEVFGIVGGNFDMLPEAIIAKSMCRLLPLPLIFLLVPALTPEDPIPVEPVEDAGAPEQPEPKSDETTAAPVAPSAGDKAWQADGFANTVAEDENDVIDLDGVQRPQVETASPRSRAVATVSV